MERSSNVFGAQENGRDGRTPREYAELRPSRRVVCAVAALLGLLIAAEPFVIDAKPSLQIL